MECLNLVRELQDVTVLFSQEASQMSGAALDRLAAAVDRLLLSCEAVLTADELKVVRLQRDLIIQKQLVSPDIIGMYTADQLMGFGFSPGTAGGLHKAFPPIAAPAAAVAAVSSTAQLEQLQKLVEVADSLKLTMELTQSMCKLIIYDQLGPMSSSSSAKAHNEDYRVKAIRFYYPELALKTKPTLRCMLTDMEFKSDDVVAGHIYRASWSRAFREVMGLRINDPGNLLLLVGGAERKFDQFQWTLKPLPPKTCQVDGINRLMQPYKVLVLNPQLLQGRSVLIADHLKCDIKWADVQGKELLFGAGEDEPKPLRRACGLHAMLAIRYAQQQGWLKATAGSPPQRLSDEDLDVDEAAWASPTFNRAHMDLYLNGLPQSPSVDWEGVVEAL